MDQNTLVSSGQALVKALDEADFSPRVAMWVYNTENDAWKLWLVPPEGSTDKLDFYRRVARTVSKRGSELGGIDASDTEMVLDTHVAIKGLGKFIKAPGLGSVYFSGNMFSGYYLPDGIILAYRVEADTHYMLRDSSCRSKARLMSVSLPRPRFPAAS